MYYTGYDSIEILSEGKTTCYFHKVYIKQNTGACIYSVKSVLRYYRPWKTTFCLLVEGSLYIVNWSILIIVLCTCTCIVIQRNFHKNFQITINYNLCEKRICWNMYKSIDSWSCLCTEVNLSLRPGTILKRKSWKCT